MSPDLLYFLIMQTTDRGFSHSWFGLAYFCLPAGMLFAYCFHRFFKYHAIVNLPRPFDSRLSGLAEQPFHLESFNSWLKLAVSVLVGALSHLFWDSFTHSTGVIAQMFPILTKSFTFWSVTRPLCRWLQHISTILGACVLLIYVLKGYLIPPSAETRPVRSPGDKVRFWLIGGVAAVLFACLVVYCFDLAYDLKMLEGHYGRSVITSFGLASWAGLYYYICIYTVNSNYRQKRR